MSTIPSPPTAHAHHEEHKARVSSPASLLFVAGPHDLDRAKGPEPAKLAQQDLLVHLRRHVPHIQIGRGGVDHVVVGPLGKVALGRRQVETLAQLALQLLPIESGEAVYVR